MATAKTKMPKVNKTTKSAAKSAQTLKNAPKTKPAPKVVPLKTEDVSAKIETLKADLAELTKSLKDSGVTYVDAKTADARAAAVEKAELAKEKYGEIAADAEAKIRANPLTAVAIAAGVGLLFGAMSRR